MILTKAQRKALKAVYDRGDNTRPIETYREFRRRATTFHFDTHVMVAWNGMWLGIETDGHTHS